MKVLFDHQTFSIQEYGGISRYFCELIDNLRIIDKSSQFELGVFLSNNKHLQDSNLTKIVPFLSKYKYKGKSSLDKLIYNANSILSKNKLSKFDILHATYYDTYYKNIIDRHKNKIKLVVTIHDMTNEKLRAVFNELNHEETILNKQKSIKYSDVIISISHNTKKDLLELYDIQPEKIHVIYHGYTDYNKTDLKAPIINGSYILFVGHRIIYKNFIRFFHSITPLLHEFNELGLICAGGGNFTEQEKFLFKQNNVSNKVRYVPIVNNSTLNNLYTNALLFVFPSLYEGFGLPVLESFGNNCPVLLSNTSSFPEVGGCAAIYFDPYSEHSIFSSIKSVINSENLRNELRNKGKERLKLFTWQNTAEKTLSLYKSLL